MKYNEVTVQQFLGALYNDFNSLCVDIRGQIATLEESISEMCQEVELRVPDQAMMVVLDHTLSRKRIDLDDLEEAKDAIEDIMGNSANTKVERLIVLYLDKIKERYAMIYPENRVAARILESEIYHIEDELAAEGFPIFGGYICYESMMNEDDEGEQINFDFDIPTK